MSRVKLILFIEQIMTNNNICYLQEILFKCDKMALKYVEAYTVIKKYTDFTK